MSNRVEDESMNQMPTMKTTRLVRVLAGIVLVIVLTSSFILSYNGLQKLAEQAHFDRTVSFIFPFSIDGMLLLGSAFYISGRKSRMARTITVFGILASIGGNVVSVMDIGWMSLVHSIPPITLLLSMALFEELVSVKTTAEARQAEVAMKAELLALKRQEREEAKLAREQKQDQPVSTPVSTKAPTASEPHEVAGTTTGTTPSTKTSTKTERVMAYVSEHPLATPREVADAIGEQPSTISTLVYRARKRVQADVAA